MRLGRRVHRGRLASRRHGRNRRKTHRYEAALRKLEESRSTAPTALTCTHAAVKIRAAWRRQNRVRGCQTSIEATPPPSGEVGISITSVERAGEEEIGDGGSARAGIGLAADERAVAAAGLIWSRWLPWTPCTSELMWHRSGAAARISNARVKEAAADARRSSRPAAAQWWTRRSAAERLTRSSLLRTLPT